MGRIDRFSGYAGVIDGGGVTAPTSECTTGMAHGSLKDMVLI